MRKKIYFTGLMRGGRKKQQEMIVVTDANGVTLFRGTVEDFPLSEELIVKLSKKFFNDPAPCEIHRSAVRIRVFYEIWEACSEEGMRSLSKLPAEMQEIFLDFPSDSRVMCLSEG